MDFEPLWSLNPKISYRCVTEINSRYYGLSLKRTLTQGPYSVRYKGSNWLKHKIWVVLLKKHYPDLRRWHDTTGMQFLQSFLNVISRKKPVVALQITTLPAVPSGIWYIYQKKILDPESSGVSINRQPKKWSPGVG